MWCNHCNVELPGKFCSECGLKLIEKPAGKRLVCVHAGIYAHKCGGSDGAYDLINPSVTVDEFLGRLREALDLFTAGKYTLTNIDPDDWCYLSINIGPAGKFEDVPLG